MAKGKLDDTRVSVFAALVTFALVIAKVVIDVKSSTGEKPS